MLLRVVLTSLVYRFMRTEILKRTPPHKRKTPLPTTLLIHAIPKYQPLPLLVVVRPLIQTPQITRPQTPNPTTTPLKYVHLHASVHPHPAHPHVEMRWDTAGGGYRRQWGRGQREGSERGELGCRGTQRWRGCGCAVGVVGCRCSFPPLPTPPGAFVSFAIETAEILQQFILHPLLPPSPRVTLRKPRRQRP